MPWRRGVRSLLGLLLLAGACRSAEPGQPLLAAFSSESRVGRVMAEWIAPGAGQGTRGLAYRVRVSNQLVDPLFVRLGRFRLLAGGVVVGVADEAAACVVPAGDTATVLRGRIDATAAADAFEVERWAVPLSERGRGFYREFRLQQRPGDTAAIDAEIASYVAAPPCVEE